MLSSSLKLDIWRARHVCYARGSVKNTGFLLFTSIEQQAFSVPGLLRPKNANINWPETWHVWKTNSPRTHENHVRCRSTLSFRFRDDLLSPDYFGMAAVGIVNSTNTLISRGNSYLAVIGCTLDTRRWYPGMKWLTPSVPVWTIYG